MGVGRVWIAFVVAIALLLVDMGSARRGATTAETTTATAVVEARARASFARLPLRFEQNVGQFDEHVRFLARRSGTTLSLTGEGATLSLHAPASHANEPTRPRHEPDGETTDEASEPDVVVRMKVAGGRDVAPVGSDLLVTKTNYFVGNDPAKWRTNVANYARVTYPAVLEGVDLVFHGEDGQLEYDFVVAPGADPKAISLDVDGATGLSLTASGDLRIETARGTLVQPRPRVYQRGDDGNEHDVQAGYRLVGDSSVGFVVASYDRQRELVIDPVLVYSTYLGGTGTEHAYAIATDAAGCAYVAGYTRSTDFPTTAGSFRASPGGPTDAFVAKLNASGSALVYATYLGGSDTTAARGLALDETGNAYVAGFTSSTTFPTTPGAFQRTRVGNQDAFVTKLNAAGSALVYSTYLGGSSNDLGYAIAVDASGSAYVTGETSSTNFPTTLGALLPTHAGGQDAFVTKLNAAGSALAYSTYLGGSSSDISSGIAVDASGSAYVAGYTLSTNFPTTSGALQEASPTSSNAFVAKLNATGSDLAYSTYLGGSKWDDASGIAVDASGSAYVAGYTQSTDFPTTAGALQAALAGTQDGFMAKLNASGSALMYATLLGGSNAESAECIAVDASGRAYVGGNTASTDFPITAGAVQTARPGDRAGFMATLDTDGSALLYSTFLGGSSSDDIVRGIAVDARGNAYVAGETSSADFPTTAEALQTTRAGSDADAFIAKIEPPLSIAPTSATVPPRGAQLFTGEGGAGAPYTYALTTNASGGSIDAATGAYTAGATGNVTDVVEVTDSDGNKATANVDVTAGVSISPASSSTPPRGSVTFTATGGAGAPYTWSFVTNASGASIDAASGAYTAGTKPGDDTVTVVDALGNSATAVVTVTPAATPSPGTPWPGTPDGGAAVVGDDSDDRGCGCVAAGSPSSRGPGALFALALAGALALTRARRRHRGANDREA